jgi:hypothetical protein
LAESEHLAFTSGVSSADLYDPATNSWSPAGDLGMVWFSQTATLLPTGKVLITGGSTFDPQTVLTGRVLSSSALYDPGTNSWSPTEPLGAARSGHTATLLPSGKVLVGGGDANGSYLSSMELYAGPLPSLPVKVALSSPLGLGEVVTLEHNGSLWLAPAAGPRLLLDDGAADVVAGLTPDGRPALFDQKSDHRLFQYDGQAWSLLDDGAGAVFAGLDATGRKAVFDQKPDGWLYQYSSGGWALLDDGAGTVVAGLTPDGKPAVFDLKADGRLYQYTSGGFTLLDDGAGAVFAGLDAAGRAALFDRKADGRLFQYSSGGFALLDDSAHTVVAGLSLDGRPAVFDLKDDGRLYQYGAGGFLLIDDGCAAISAVPGPAGAPGLLDHKPDGRLFAYVLGGWLQLG